MTEPMITLEWLREHGAWEDSTWAWEDRFGDRATVADTVKWLHERGEGYWEAWLLAQTPEMTKAALAAGADVHAANDEALVKVAKEGYAELAKILCAAGIDVNAQDGAALRAAVLCGHRGIVKELRAAGADFSVIDADLLVQAKDDGDAEVVNYVKAVMEGKDV